MQYDAAFNGPYFTVDTLTINRATDANGCDWVLTQEKGWYGKPAIKTNRMDRPASRGAIIGSEHPAARVLTLGWVLSAPDTVTLRNAVDQVLGICADSSTLYPVTCTDERGITLQALAKLDGEILVTPLSALSVDVSVQLVCPDPRKTNIVQNVATAGLVAAGVGGVVYPIKYPVNYGTPGASGSLTLVNKGTAPADVVITIVGPVTQPTLTNPADGSSISFLGGLNANDRLTIDTNSGRVLLNGVDRRGLLYVTKWPRIPRNGTLRLSFTSTNSADTGTVVAVYSDTYY